MLKITIKLLLLLVITLTISASIFAQTTQSQYQNEWEKIFTRASETATFESGKIKTVKLPIDGQEKTFTFEHSQDGKTVTITDEQNVKIQVFLDGKNRIVRMVFPEGGEAVIEWQDTGNGGMIPSNIILKENGTQFTSLVAAGNACMDALERAGAATVVAIGVCAGSPGSVACWSATATAGYLTYVAYRTCRINT